MIPPGQEAPAAAEAEEKPVGTETTTDSEKPLQWPKVEVETTDSYSDAEHKFDIVAVHGLYGNSESWASKKDGSDSWLKDLAVAKDWEARVVRYGWDTDDLAKSLYTRMAIKGEALKLLEKIAELRKGQERPLPLAFFGHDVGGIIVKEALFLAGHHGNKYADIRCSTRVIMFYGCPHLSNSFQHMETNVARFLVGGAEGIGTVQDAKSLTKSIIAVNDSFLQTKMPTRATIINGISKGQTINAQVFDGSTTLFRTPFEVIIEIKRPHKDLNHEPEEKDDFHGLHTLGIKRAASFPWRNDKMSPFIAVIDSQAVPVYPLKTLCDVPHKFSWLGENPVFKEWRNNRHNYFLHLYGSPRIAQVAEYALQVVEDGRSGLFENLYFKFNKHDIRRNSIGAMANSFISQILSQCRDSPSSLIGDLEPPDFSDCWTDKDALIFLDKIRVCMGNAGRVTWILDGLDQCDESGRGFLSQLITFPTRSEQYFKVVITTTDDDYIRDTLLEFPSINVGEHEPKTQFGEKTNFLRLTELFQDRPQLYSFESGIRDLIISCGDDVQLRRLIIEWLRGTRFTTQRAMEQKVRMLSPPERRDIFEMILNGMTVDRRRWAQKVIMWMLCPFRPLTPGELEMALAMDEALDEPTLEFHLDFMEEINECFGPLVVVNNGEVHFSHPSAREIFSYENTSLEDPRSWYVLDVPEESHRNIVDVCLRYLALPSVQDQIAAACNASPNAEPICEGHSDLLSYAILFWPQHYRLGYEVAPDVSTTKAVSNFLHNDKALQRWAAASWYFSNPSIRSDRSFLSPLPIIASLGLEKLAVALIKGQEPCEDKIVAMALSEAARHGHRAVVQTIMRTSSIDQPGYMEAMIAAARSAEFDILQDLLNHATAEFKALQLPDILTSRVAFFGVDGVLESLIKAGAEVNSPVQPEYSPPLHCAAVRNNISTVDILLKHGANVNGPNTNWKNSPPIVVAAKYGHAAMAKTLVEAGASVESKDSEGKLALWWAALLGQHEVVQSLIDAGVDKGSVEVSVTEELDYPIFGSTASASFPKCARALLNYGVNPNIPKSKSTYPKYALGQAANAGDADMCRLLIEFGADVDGTDNDKPIVHAAMSGKREVLDIFLEKGADIDVLVEGDDFAQTPLIAAADLNHKDLVSILLEKNAALETALSNGVTALFRAAGRGNLEIAKLLIAAGADLKTVAYEKKWGLLHIAHSQVETMKVLLDAGVDIDATCRDGSPLYLAAYNCHPEAVKLLVSRGANPEITCQEQSLWDDGYTPLQAMAVLGYTEIMRTILEGGANTKSKTPMGSTPLMLAVNNENEECVKALLEYDPDLEAVNESKDTALHTSTITTPLSIIKLLVNRGANIEHRGRDNYTFLGQAVTRKRLDIVTYLLEKKANINVVGGYRAGPIHVAAASGQLEILKLLVSKGGDVNLADPNISGTPLQATLYPDADEVYDDTAIDTIFHYLIDEAGADVNAHAGYLGSALNVASLGMEDKSVEYMQLLLDKGADINYTDTFGRRAIHYASFRTLPQVRLLLDAGADITAKTKIGQSPLHIAVASKHLDVVELVLSKTKHLINQPDIDGWTPLMWACRPADKWGAASSIDIAVIKLLLSHGADPWARGKSGDREWSPLKLARYHGASAEVVRLLTPKGKKRSTSSKSTASPSPSKDGAWDAKFHTSKRANRTPGYCDVCLFGIYGIVTACTECLDAFYICFKCCSRKTEFHPQHDKWELIGTEYVVDEEQEVESGDTSEHNEGGLVEQVEDDDEEGDWSNDDV